MTPGKQRELFGGGLEESAPAKIVADVVFNRPLRAVFSYAVPAMLEDQIAVGKRVTAPFGKGNNRTQGYCVGVRSRESVPTSAKLKWLHGVGDEIPLLSPALVDLARWMSDEYYCGWGQALEAIVPAAVKDKAGGRWRPVLHAVLEPAPVGLTAKQRRVYDALVALGRPADYKELSRIARCGVELPKILVEKGAATVGRERVFGKEPPRLSDAAHEPPLPLSPAQTSALAPDVSLC